MPNKRRVKVEVHPNPTCENTVNKTVPTLLLLLSLLAPSAAAAAATTTLKTLNEKLDRLAALVGRPSDGAEIGRGLYGLVENLSARAGLDDEIAVLMAVPIQSSCFGVGGTGRPECSVRLYVLGSTIPNWPTNVSRSGFSNPTLPPGTYLIELQQPYSDNLACHHGGIAYSRLLAKVKWRGDCPQLLLAAAGIARNRLDDGFGIFTATSSTSLFLPKFRFPIGTSFSGEGNRLASSYVGSIKITKLR